MTDTTFEATLGTQLRQYADGGVRPIDRHAIAERTIGAGTRRGWLRRVDGRVRVLAIVGLLLLALAAAFLVLGVGRNLSPDRSLDYEAVFLRASVSAPDTDVDIVMARSDGQEREVRHLAASGLPDGRVFETYGSVSQDGWIAVGTHIGPPGSETKYAWALYDLTDPARAPRLVPYSPVLGGRWGPGGLFATTHPGDPQCCAIDVIDAASGARTSLGHIPLPGGGPDIIWAADGSGLLVHPSTDDPAYTDDPAFRPFAVWQVGSGGGRLVAGVPPLAPGTDPRWVAPGGTTLTFDGCATGVEDPGCKRASGSVQTIDAQNTVTQWYSGLPETLVAASLSADGRAIWLLLDGTSGADHAAVIARVGAPGQAQIVTTLHLGKGNYPFHLSGLAPDDSSIAIDSIIVDLLGESTIGPTRLISTSDGRSTTHAGHHVGFVPSSVADAWPGGSAFAPVP
jgi:hypothetical protein